MIRVVVVDDHGIVRAGLEALVGKAGDMELVGTANDGGEALRVIAETEPDVVLMDLSMPVLGGVEATRRVVRDHPGCRVIALTSFSEDDWIREALAAGAEGYVLKHAAPDEIIAAIRAAQAGGAPLDPRAARVLLESRRLDPVRVTLTERETQVLLAVREGLPNKQIARRLCISEKTVKTHLSRVFHQLGVRDRTQAAVWATRHLLDG